MSGSTGSPSDTLIFFQSLGAAAALIAITYRGIVIHRTIRKLRAAIDRTHCELIRRKIEEESNASPK